MLQHPIRRSALVALLLLQTPTLNAFGIHEIIIYQHIPAGGSAPKLPSWIKKPFDSFKTTGDWYISIYKKTGSDTLATIQKAGKDAFATYVKAINDTSREAQKSFDDSVDAARASYNFGERQLKGIGDAAESAAKRAREGKFVDAMLHWSIDQHHSTENNVFKATQESEIIAVAVSSAATAYAGPGGAAAYAAWATYRATGNADLAFRNALFAAASTQAGTLTANMPAGTAGQMLVKSAAAGAAGGIATAVEGGDQNAIGQAFLKAGGKVLIQTSQDYVKGYLSDAQNDAVQAIDCLSARDIDCLKNTTYARDGKKFLTDKAGNFLPRTMELDQVTEAWKAFDKTSTAGKNLEKTLSISKIPTKQAIPIMNNQFVITWSLPKDGSKAPVVVITQMGEKPMFDFQTNYTKTLKEAKTAAIKAAAPKCKADVVPERSILVDSSENSCRTLEASPYGGSILLWGAAARRAICDAKAIEHLAKVIDRRDVCVKQA